MEERYESFAAIAIFKEMYDQKKDVYDIIASLCRDVICIEKLTRFSLPEITNAFNNKFSFSLREPIIKTGLKRLKVNKENGIYTVEESFFDQNINNVYDIQSTMNSNLLDNLYSYVEEKNKTILKKGEKEQLKQSFFKYLMEQDSSDEYNEIINKYILSVSLKAEYIDTIRKIKEGLLIYDGIRYSGNVAEVGRWNSRLNIYMEQEVLFYIAGFNGEIHQEIYNEFLRYVSEINRGKTGEGKLIRLWYDQEVKGEIDSYFKAAETIVQKGEIADPSKKPMMYILDGAKTSSDVVEKRVKFYKLLEQKGICFFEYNYYDADNYKYNLFDKEVYNTVIKKYQQCDVSLEDLQKYCNKINGIAILRKNQNMGFDNVEHILMTAKGIILQIGYEDGFYNLGEVPKATTVDFLLNKMWFKLNKGFGEGKTPKTIDVITHARIALSFLANDRVEKIYEEVKQKYNDNIIGKDEAINLIAELRSYSKTPDDVNAVTIEDEINALSQFEVNKRVEELKREELERKQDKQRIKELEDKIKQINEANDSRFAERERSQKKRDEEMTEKLSNIESKNQKLIETVERLEKEKKNIIKDVRKQKERLVLQHV